VVPCKHTALEFLPARKRTLRCRHCHLTLDGEELGDGYCPECYDQSGERRYDFDELEALDDGAAKYRCEKCGAIITSS
jgi:rubrerythrin